MIWFTNLLGILSRKITLDLIIMKIRTKYLQNQLKAEMSTLNHYQKLEEFLKKSALRLRNKTY